MRKKLLLILLMFLGMASGCGHNQEILNAHQELAGLPQLDRSEQVFRNEKGSWDSSVSVTIYELGIENTEFMAVAIQNDEKWQQMPFSSAANELFDVIVLPESELLADIENIDGFYKITQTKSSGDLYLLIYNPTKSQLIIIFHQN